MKNISLIVLFIFISISFLLTGCSKKTTSTTTKSTTTSSEDYFPGIDRTTVVEPSLSSSAYNATTTSRPSSETIKTNLKIGSISQIKASRYDLSGLIKIISTTGVSLDNFTYNGQCSGFNLYLTRSNNPTQVVVPFDLKNSAYSNYSTTINFPSGVTINDIDSVAMTCSNYEEPIFTNQLEQ